MRYSIEPKDRIYVKGYGFLSFAKNMGQKLSNKYGQKLLDSTKKSAADAIKTASKRTIQNTAEATGDLIGNKITDKITSVSINPSNHKPIFQGIKILFVLAFENDDQRTSNKRYYIPNVEIKDYNVMIDGENFFDQPVKNDKVTYENIRKIATGQGDDYTTGCLLNYTYFKKYYKMIAIDLSK